MIIHSVTPSYFLLMGQNSVLPETRRFEGGFLEGYYSGQDFIISRVISTDPKYYIDEKYFPGCKF